MSSYTENPAESAARDDRRSTVADPERPLVMAELSLARRAEFFRQIVALESTSLAPFERATFGRSRGWLISDMSIAAELLSRSVGVKSRPTDQQSRLGGVGAARGEQVRSKKRDLIGALNTLCQEKEAVAEHIQATLGDVQWKRATGPLTEGLTASTITLATSSRPGSLPGPVVRDAVSEAWVSVEEGMSATQDALSELLLSRLHSQSAIMRLLKEPEWTRESIAEELRAMLLAGWGSTSAIALSSVSLGVRNALGERGVLDEVFRLVPPSFMIARVLDRSYSGLPFSIGDTVVVSPWLIQRSPRYWVDPLIFNPNRWTTPPDPPAFMPFGRGPRRCPAQTLARVQAREAVTFLPEMDDLRGKPRLAMVEGRSPALIPAEWTVASIYPALHS